MIGKSYDGTFANGVAATGVDGLTTIVPISAISDWYDYSRMGGIRFNTHYPASLSRHAASRRATRRRTRRCSASCRRSTTSTARATRTAMSAVGTNGDGDTDGDINHVLARPRLQPRTSATSTPPSSSRTASTTTTSARPLRAVVGRPRREQRPAQALALAGGPRRPVRLPPRASGSTRCTAGSTTGSRACRTGSWTSRRWTSRRRRTRGRPHAELAAPDTKPIDVYLQGTAAGATGRARRSAPAGRPTR